MFWYSWLLIYLCNEYFNSYILFIYMPRLYIWWKDQLFSEIALDKYRGVACLSHLFCASCLFSNCVHLNSWRVISELCSSFSAWSSEFKTFLIFHCCLAIRTGFRAVLSHCIHATLLQLVLQRGETHYIECVAAWSSLLWSHPVSSFLIPFLLVHTAYIPCVSSCPASCTHLPPAPALKISFLQCMVSVCFLWKLWFSFLWVTRDQNHTGHIAAVP